jgi:hypothetical protein
VFRSAASIPVYFIFLFFIVMAPVLITGCESFPRHYVKLNQCLIEQGSIGEDHLVAYAELEDWLLEQKLLEGSDKASYKRLLVDVATGSQQIQAYDAAPEVRDFWALQEGGSFGAFFSCSKDLSEELEDEEAASIHRMHRIFEQMREAAKTGGEAGYKDPELLESLTTEAISDEDFEFVLYRASLLNLLVFMMD